MIDIKEVEYYNKISAFAKGKYRSWNASEDKAMKEAAPLLKFTLGKTIRETEDRHINEILNYGTLAGATHVVVTCGVIQFLVSYDSYQTLRTQYVTGNSIKTHLINYSASYYSTCATDNTWKMTSIEVARYERYAGVLPFDTKRDGMYIRRADGAFTLERNRKKLISLYDQLGYVSRPGTPPTAVSPDEVSKGEMTRVLDVLAFCNQMGSNSVWSRALAGPLKKSIINYRSLDTMQHEHAIKKIINAAKTSR